MGGGRGGGGGAADGGRTTAWTGGVCWGDGTMGGGGERVGQGYWGKKGTGCTEQQHNGRGPRGHVSVMLGAIQGAMAPALPVGGHVASSALPVKLTGRPAGAGGGGGGRSGWGA